MVHPTTESDSSRENGESSEKDFTNWEKWSSELKTKDSLSELDFGLRSLNGESEKCLDSEEHGLLLKDTDISRLLWNWESNSINGKLKLESLKSKSTTLDNGEWESKSEDIKDYSSDHPREQEDYTKCGLLLKLTDKEASLSAPLYWKDNTLKHLDSLVNTDVYSKRLELFTTEKSK